MALLPGPGAQAAPPYLSWGLRAREEGREAEAGQVRRKSVTPSKTEGCGRQTAALPALPVGRQPCKLTSPDAALRTHTPSLSYRFQRGCHPR